MDKVNVTIKSQDESVIITSNKAILKGEKGDTGTVDYTQVSSMVDDIINELPDVVSTGDYNDLINKPTIHTYTAGDNITITNDVISATDTKYTAGSNITIENNVISSTSGGGDMAKAIYDTNNNGIVDNAEKVNNHTVEKDVPNDAIFTDTTYSDATTSSSGLMTSSDKSKLDGIEENANNVTVVNNLTSTSEIDALSANQGRFIYNQIPVIKKGIVSGYDMAANAITADNVVFDKPFPNAPNVQVTLYSASGNKSLGSTHIAISNVSTNGFTWRFFNNTSSAYSPYIYWIAIG